MLEVAADANAFGEDIERGLDGAGAAVVKADVSVDPVADPDGACPAGRGVAEEVAGDERHLVDLAVAAAEEELQDFRWELFDRMLYGFGADGVDDGFGGDEAVAAEAKHAGRSEEAGAAIAEAVDVFGYGDGLGGVAVDLFDEEFFGEADAAFERGVEAQQADHGGGLRAVEIR